VIENRITADRMRTQASAQAAVLAQASREHAAVGKVVEAVAAAWAVEVLMLQATLASQVLVDRRAPNYRYFESAERIVQALDLTWAPADSAAATIRAGRQVLAQVVEPVVLSELSDAFVSLDYLEDVPGLDDGMVTAFTQTRLRGTTAQRLVQTRRQEVADAMLQAQSMRMRGDVPGAIRRAYEADFGALEAYLVESATAAGDQALFTVSTRWDLAAFAMAQLAGLPESFEPAVQQIRHALVQALGEPDGSRLALTFTAM
jgi:hypothetical protein